MFWMVGTGVGSRVGIPVAALVGLTEGKLLREVGLSLRLAEAKFGPSAVGLPLELPEFVGGAVAVRLSGATMGPRVISDGATETSSPPEGPEGTDSTPVGVNEVVVLVGSGVLEGDTVGAGEELIDPADGTGEGIVLVTCCGRKGSKIGTALTAIVGLLLGAVEAEGLGVAVAAGGSYTITGTSCLVCCADA